MCMYVYYYYHTSINEGHAELARPLRAVRPSPIPVTRTRVVIAAFSVPTAHVGAMGGGEE